MIVTKKMWTAVEEREMAAKIEGKFFNELQEILRKNFKQIIVCNDPKVNETHYNNRHFINPFDYKSGNQNDRRSRSQTRYDHNGPRKEESKTRYDLKNRNNFKNRNDYNGKSSDVKPMIPYNETPPYKLETMVTNFETMMTKEMHEMRDR